ncbi:Uncharacterised protein [Mycobacteroides abscessus subsp. abscessus]|nr:Uncharacterised protein [Mycobacteroides abscessus subsp. abscessus]
MLSAAGTSRIDTHISSERPVVGADRRSVSFARSGSSTGIDAVSDGTRSSPSSTRQSSVCASSVIAKSSSTSPRTWPAELLWMR